MWILASVQGVVNNENCENYLLVLFQICYILCFCIIALAVFHSESCTEEDVLLTFLLRTFFSPKYVLFSVSPLGSGFASFKGNFHGHISKQLNFAFGMGF